MALNDSLMLIFQDEKEQGMRPEKNKGMHSYELWRRVFLLMGCALALWLFAYASPAPLVRINLADITRMQERELERLYVTDRNRHLAALEPLAYLEEVAEENLIYDDLDPYAFFLENLHQVSQRNVPPQWAKRVGPESLRSGYTPLTYFRAEEAPVSSWVSQWSDRSSPLYVLFGAVSEADDLTVIQMTYLPRPLEDIGFGGRSILQPPNRLVRASPLWPLLALLLGLLGYLILPRDRSRNASLVYPKWKTYMADFALVLIFTVFFAMPLLVAGNALHAVGEWLPLTLVFWLLAAFSFWLASVNAWSASFSLVLSQDGLEMSSYRGQLSLPFNAVRSAALVEKKTPRWMRMLLWMSLLVASGSMRFLTASQLMTTSGTVNRGIRFYKKDGTYLDLWILDGGVRELVLNEDAFLEAMKNAGVPWEQEPVLDRTLNDMPGGGRLWSRRPVLVPFSVIIIAILSVVILSGFVGASQARRTPAFAGISGNQPDKAGAQAPGQHAELTWGDLRVNLLNARWVRVYGGAGVERTDALSWAGNGGFWAGGLTTTDQGMRTPGYILMLDRQGEVQHEFIYALPGKDTYLADLKDTGQSRLLMTGTAGTYAGWDAFIAAADYEGQTIWHHDLNTEENSGGHAVLSASETLIIWSGHVGSNAFLKGLDVRGEVLFEVSPAPEAAGSSVHALLAASDGFWLAGAVTQDSDGFSDAFAARLDVDGNTIVSWTGGGDRDDVLLAGALRDEGLVLAGSTRSGGGLSQELYLVSLDNQGSLVWEQSVGLPGHHVTGVAAGVHPDGDLLFLGNIRTDDVMHLWSFLLRTDPDGNPLSVHRLWAEGNLRAADMLLDQEDGNIVIGATTGRLEDRGEASIALAGLLLEDLVIND